MPLTEQAYGLRRQDGPSGIQIGPTESQLRELGKFKGWNYYSFDIPPFDQLIRTIYDTYDPPDILILHARRFEDEFVVGERMRRVFAHKIVGLPYLEASGLPLKPTGLEHWLAGTPWNYEERVKFLANAGDWYRRGLYHTLGPEGYSHVIMLLQGNFPDPQKGRLEEYKRLWLAADTLFQKVLQDLSDIVPSFRDQGVLDRRREFQQEVRHSPAGIPVCLYPGKGNVAVLLPTSDLVKEKAYPVVLNLEQACGHKFMGLLSSVLTVPPLRQTLVSLHLEEAAEREAHPYD